MTSYCMNELTSKGNTITELTRAVFHANKLLLETSDRLAAPDGLSGASWQIPTLAPRSALLGRTPRPNSTRHATVCT